MENLENMIVIGEKINGFVPRTCKAIEERDDEYISYRPRPDRGRR